MCFGLSEKIIENISIQRKREEKRGREREKFRCVKTLRPYGVATMSRMLKNTGLFAEYRSLL